MKDSTVEAVHRETKDFRRTALILDTTEGGCSFDLLDKHHNLIARVNAFNYIDHANHEHVWDLDIVGKVENVEQDVEAIVFDGLGGKKRYPSGGTVAVLVALPIPEDYDGPPA